MVRALWMTNQHVVKPFTKICFLLKSISALLACSQQCFSVNFCRKFVNITQICKYYANLQILHIFANVSQRKFGTNGVSLLAITWGEGSLWLDIYDAENLYFEMIASLFSSYYATVLKSAHCATRVLKGLQ